MRIAIVGGGIFGITASIILAKNHQVELFEKNNELLQSASGSNQYRIHRGYHYPRSPDTVKDIIESETFPFSIILVVIFIGESKYSKKFLRIS